MRLDRHGPVGLAGRALIEGHDDVRAQRALDVHYAFGREQVARAVDVTLEEHTIVAHLVDGRQTEHLEAARVGQDGHWPMHELDAARPARAPRPDRDASRGDTCWPARSPHLHQRLRRGRAS